METFERTNSVHGAYTTISEDSKVKQTLVKRIKLHWDVKNFCRRFVRIVPFQGE